MFLNYIKEHPRYILLCTGQTQSMLKQWQQIRKSETLKCPRKKQNQCETQISSTFPRRINEIFRHRGGEQRGLTIDLESSPLGLVNLLPISHNLSAEFPRTGNEGQVTAAASTAGDDADGGNFGREGERDGYAQRK